LLLRRTFGGLGPRALEALTAGDMPGFAASMRRAKWRVVARFWARHPVRAARGALAGSLDRVRLFRTRPCGFRVRAHLPTRAHRRRLQDALRCLGEANVLYRWTDADSDRKRTTRLERAVMERGGIAIKRSAPADAQLDLERLRTPQQIARAVTHLLIRRHPGLFLRKGQAA
jgi:hypothetical protein